MCCTSVNCMYVPNDGKSGDGKHDGRIHHLNHVMVDVVLLQSSVLEVMSWYVHQLETHVHACFNHHSHKLV